MAKSYYNVLEILVNICSVEKGKLKILLKRKTVDPYKGYWILPGDIVSKDETLEEKANSVILDTTGLPAITLMQSNIFSNINRDPEERIIASTFIAITIKNAFKTSENSDLKWFGVDELPKMGYDHQKIIKENMHVLKRKIINNDEGILLKLFPSDFTLSELQKLFENITGKELDRRNFRKKIISQNYVIDTLEKHASGAGRPGKLYKLNPEIKDKSFID